MTTKLKLSEIPEYKNTVIAFLKFTDYIDSLVEGNLYMNNLEYYIELEKKSGVRGMGDLLEAAHVFSNIDVKFVASETGKLAMPVKRGNISIRQKGIEKTPVYCLLALTSNDLTIVEETEDVYIAEVNFPQEEVEKLVSEFGEKVVLIEPNTFIERVLKTFKEKGYEYSMGKVNYDDYSVNSTKRIESYMKNNNEIFFWKDIFFENQNEFRIAIPNLPTDEPIIVNIGDIRDITHVYDARELLNGSLFDLEK